MQKLSLILPKIIINRNNTDTIKQCIIDNWKSIIPDNITPFTKLYKVLLKQNFQLKVCIQVLGASIIIVKMYENEIINNIRKFTKVENVYLTYQQVLSINNDITRS